ncbi:MAG: S1 RNA-binding domain-containing protein [Clostridia bacterium]|nr:S1 RNA-binding domain-containing protein [Clostridia bacterium]
MEKIVKGKVTKITSFGAFVAVEGGASGMIHISEISQSYVKNIKDFLTEGQEIECAVVSSDENGRLALSLKRLPQKTAAGAASLPPENFLRAPKSSDNSLESMITRFKNVSEDKLGDLKKGGDVKRARSGRRNKH